MPYSTSYADILNLLGSRSAHEIDDSSREARAGLDERFRDIIYNVEADPWKVKIPGVASDGTQAFNVPAVTAVHANAVAMTRELNGIHPTTGGTTITAVIPIQLESGAQIVAFAIAGTRTDAVAVVQATLYAIANDVPTALATLSLPGTGGYDIESSGVIGYNVDSGTALYVFVQLTAAATPVSAQLHHIRINRKLAGTF